MQTTVIVVGGTKGGPGKSTIAQQVAAYLILKKKKTVFILDIDPQMTTARWCEDRSENEDLTIIPFAAKQHDIDQTIASLRGRYDFVVIDAGGFDSDIQRHALRHSDVVLLPLRPKRRDLRSLGDVDTVVAAARVSNPDLKAYVVMNQCPSLPSQAKRILVAKDVCETFGLETTPVNLYNRNVYDDAEWAGRSIFEVTGSERDPKAEAEIQEVTNFILSGGN
ncbi:TPA: AAA family ATPase [Klebsiella pneumoniae]|nr:AAA family ATPase [Klebsiella pneumoniae]